MDFAPAHPAPALARASAAAVPEAEAFAGTKAATKEVEAAIAEEGIPTPAAAAAAFFGSESHRCRICNSAKGAHPPFQGS